MVRKNYNFKVFLGNDKETKERVYLTGFKWDCEWYWGGGYLEYRTRNNRGWRMHTHFDSVFLDKTYKNNGESTTGLWLHLFDILDNAKFTSNEWWRIKDLYVQFYALQKAAEVFQYGGHCTSKDRSKEEINIDIANRINSHIENVIIPEIKKALKIE